ncbi:spore coat protein YsxE [Bacillus ectoiniformans]|uniref:spore coat protein YsxE n=1 Tax=Bacillus ectoiniformans TaxID=1494429 RepID=UPI00195A3FD9|nr:spore coat protein YsxE [Bacillus ectoiniformans]
MKQSLSAVWQSYGLKPQHVEQNGRVQKLVTKQGTFALKRIPAAKGMNFIHGMQRLYQSGYHRLVPVYPALDGRYGVLDGGYIYYLMPWVEAGKHRENNELERKMLREAARIHTLSVREVESDPESRLEHYNRTKAQWESQEEQLEKYLLLAEKEVYMSPFQLMFCLYYRDLSQSFTYAKERLKDWKEETKEEKKTRVVHIHGHLAAEHFLMDASGGGYFINLEQSRPASPLHDLIPYFVRSFDTFPKKAETDLEHYRHYTEHFPLKKGEVSLLQSYLAYPGAMYQTIVSYFTDPTKYNEQRFTEKLQRQYWLLKNLEYFVVQLQAPSIE